MTSSGDRNIYARIGARPVINAGGNTTVWGGSTPSPEVMRAMEEAGRSFVEMEELLGVEAAYVTAGCYAALVLCTAACITGNDPEKAAQLPDTTGLKGEIVLQEKQRYGYDRAYTIAGSRLALAGNEDGCTADELDAAIGSDTAAVAYLVRPANDGTVVSLDDAVEIAHRRGVPVIADAAAQIYPLDYLRRNAQSADLACFGGKYMGAPQSTGFLCGKKQLVQAAISHGYIGPRPLGRGMKVDRQEIVGLVVAVEDWLTQDHEERLIGYGTKFSVIERALAGATRVKETKVVSTGSFFDLALQVVLDTEGLGKSAQDVARELLDGSPRIRLGNSVGDGTLVVNVHTLNEGEDQALGDRMRDLLA